MLEVWWKYCQVDNLFPRKSLEVLTELIKLCICFEGIFEGINKLLRANWNKIFKLEHHTFLIKNNSLLEMCINFLVK